MFINVFWQVLSFPAQRHASMVHAVVVCLSVCLSVTSWCFTEMAKHRIMQTMPHDSPETPDFLCQRSWQHSNTAPHWRCQMQVG